LCYCHLENICFLIKNKTTISRDDPNPNLISLAITKGDHQRFAVIYHDPANARGPNIVISVSVTRGANLVDKLDTEVSAAINTFLGPRGNESRDSVQETTTQETTTQEATTQVTATQVTATQVTATQDQEIL
jgi:hypothetical protein